MNKQKKPFITRMRMFIAAGSIVGMVGGWALLAQADTPVSTANTTAALIESAPTQSAQVSLATGTSAANMPATAALAASTPTSTATATKVTTTTKLPVLRTRSS